MRSDVAVKRIEGDDRLEEFKKERLELKSKSFYPKLNSGSRAYTVL